MHKVSILSAYLIFMTTISLCFGTDFSVNQQALKLYHEGSYRQSMALLSNRQNLSDLETYILARDYQELEDPAAAVQVFGNLEPSRLSALVPDNFLLENWAYYYSTALKDWSAQKAAVLPLALEGILSIEAGLPPQSAFLPGVRAIKYALLWKAKDYHALSMLTATNEPETAYRQFAFAAQGDFTNLLKAVDYTSARYFNPMVLDLNYEWDSNSVTLFNQVELLRLLPLFLDAKKTASAKAMLNRYYALTKDRDLYERNMAVIRFKSGEKQAATSALLSYCLTNRGSLKSYQTLVSLCYNSGNYTQAAAALKTAVKIFGDVFYTDYIKTLAALNRDQELSNWYFATAKTGMPVSGEAEKRLFRTLLRLDETAARKVCSASLIRQKTPFFMLMQGLFDDKDGDIAGAYSNFAAITLQEPYTYEWLVAKRHEALLRAEQREIFDSVWKDTASSLTNASTLDKAKRLSAMKDADPARFAKEGLDLKLKAAMTVYQKEKVDPMFQKPDGLTAGLDSLLKDPVLSMLNREIMNSMERLAIGETAKYQLSWEYYPVYEKLDLTGYVVARLNFYISKGAGRIIHPLLTGEFQKRIYPLIYLDRIMQREADTNRAIWYLSAFREESQFIKDTVSSVGAVGLSQLMQSTANDIKRRAGHPEWSVYDFSDNINIGTALFQYLFKKYKGNTVYALAAYNAGESAVNRWIKKFRPGFPNELWTECIDYDETRDYVKKIGLTRYFYCRIYNLPEGE